jgi:hypothetical protein
MIMVAGSGNGDAVVKFSIKIMESVVDERAWDILRSPLIYYHGS